MCVLGGGGGGEGQATSKNWLCLCVVLMCSMLDIMLFVRLSGLIWYGIGIVLLCQVSVK